MPRPHARNSDEKNEQKEADEKTIQGVLQTERSEEKNNDTHKNEKQVVMVTKTIREADNATGEVFCPSHLGNGTKKLSKE
jgi:hypothetical protein